MPQFSWEPLDFLEALEVLPIEEELGISYRYLVARGPISLDLTIWPFSGDVSLLLACEGVAEPLMTLNLLESPGARVVRGGQGTVIEFAAASSSKKGTTTAIRRRMDSGCEFNRSSR